MSLEKGLIGHWTLDSVDIDGNTVRDSSGYENHAQNNGATETQGLGQDALDFNGTDDFVETGLSFDKQDFTYAAWVNIDSAGSGSFNDIIDSYESSSSEWARIGVQDGNARFIVDNNSTKITLDGQSLNLDEWYHIAGVRIGNQINLYVDGVLDAQTEFSQIDVINGIQTERIGARSDDGTVENLDGTIQDARVYDRALSESEINSLYQKRGIRVTSSRGFPVAAENLVAHYPFRDGSARDDARNANYADSTPYDGVVTGATYDSDKGPNGNGAFVFDGDDKITVDPINNLPTNEFTVSVWHNRDSLDVCYWHMPDSSGNNTNSLFSNSNEYNYIRNDNSFQPSISISNSWEHVLISGDGSTATIYQNGSSIGNTSYNSFNFEGVFYIGVDVDGSPRGGFSEFFSGQIADVRIYDKGLSSSKVNQLYENTRPQISASGGSTITTETINGEQYRIHAFENVGTSTFEVSDAQANATVDVLVVGGGGGGGSGNPDRGGGGAGGVVFNTESITSGNKTITVGNGGSPNDSAGGGNSTALGLTAIGGGSANSFGDGFSGGSGAGGGGDGAGASALQPGTNSDAQIDAGFEGGSGGRFLFDDGGNSAGGGGGAGGAGGNGEAVSNGEDGGDGGIGLDFSNIFGTEFGENGFFGGGGGGCAGDGNAQDGIGGLGGGADAKGGSGQPNTGGGGAGDNTGGDGGSGIVLIRYKL